MEPHATAKFPTRRKFIHSIAAGAATIGLSSFEGSSTPPEATFSSPGVEDAETWINRIKGKHKMVFDVTQPHEILPFAWPRVFLLTNESTGAAEKDCCAVVVLRHTAIPYAFDHNMWAKYKFGEAFKAPDPATGKPAEKNPFWKPEPGTFKVAGVGPVLIGINELMSNGVMFCVCNVAITVLGNTMAASMNQDAEALIRDWKQNLLPGIQVVPSGIWAVGRAQEKGCGYVFAG